MHTHYSDEYRVSARVVLRPGDRFRVSGGPYWRGSNAREPTDILSVDLLIGESSGLDGRATYIWARRPSWVCRLDVRTHAGWADKPLIDTIAANMAVPWHVIERMRETVAAHAD